MSRIFEIISFLSPPRPYFIVVEFDYFDGKDTSDINWRVQIVYFADAFEHQDAICKMHFSSLHNVYTEMSFYVYV